MTTPFGTAIATYHSKQDFYAKYPGLAEGWNPEKHPGSAPLGRDLVPGAHGDWLVVFCAPDKNFRSLEPVGKGTVVAFERPTGIFHVLAESIGYPAAKARYEA